MSVCEWCGVELPPTSPRARRQRITCSESHRALRHRWLNDVRRSGGRGPVDPPPWSPLWDHAARLVDDDGERRRPPKRSKPSGIQVSYRKAVEAVQRMLLQHYPDDDEDALGREAERVMRGALSEKQRARLDERNA